MPQDAVQLEAAPSTPTRSVQFRLLGAGLVVLVLIAYAPVFSADFITADDSDYVVSNQLFRDGLSWTTVVRCFTQYHAANWHPITWLSHLIDLALYGLDPAGHHATNVLLHLLGSLLLFRLVERWLKNTLVAAIIALFFALHPVQVESVAWVSERKNVLSLFFGLICLWAYTSYVLKPSVLRYLLVLFWLALGLMSKPMLVTWPCVLLLLDVWPLGRTRWAQAAEGVLSECSATVVPVWRLLVEKIPMLVMVGFACVLTMRAQKDRKSTRLNSSHSSVSRMPSSA